MFSAKNYGLPKDLIEAAKRVHEKQLEEGVGKYAEPRVNPKIHKQEGEVKNILHDLAGRKKEEMNKELPGAKKPQAKKSQTEEVQFTEEELAEAFAIFLEENFHVDMLTEEDLDYVFENEFPQWLEEGMGRAIVSGISKFFSGGAKTAGAAVKKGAGAVTNVGRKVDKAARQNPVSTAVTGVGAGALGATSLIKKPTQTGYGADLDAANKIAGQKATATAVQSDTGGPGETGVGDKPAQTTARKQVSVKPAASARKPAPKIDYKTPVTRRGPDGTYGLTSKGRKYVARKEAQERKKPFSASKFFSQMQRDGN